MCGLVGFAGAPSSAVVDPLKLLRAMGDAMSHRGPDDAGAWWDAAAGVGFSHRRLAIVDLTAAGHQPMASASGRYLIAYNGEIYNHLELRKELEARGAAPAWRGHADTETLLAAIDHWGLVGAIGRSAGMFAFALWDARERTLHLARDRLGEKPLYFGWQQEAFLFGSDVAAFRQYPGFSPAIDRTALEQFLRFGYVLAPRSIYEGISKLAPGHVLSLRLPGPELTIQAYWSPPAKGASSGRSEHDTIDALEVCLREAVRGQMMADVPLGAFLSGGIDSSLIVALMQQLSERPVQTFTIGFGEAAYNEAQQAGDVAARLGTDHTELYLSGREAMDVIPLLPSVYSEPFADVSQIPTYLVSKLARRQVTVVLSGDGGDELFGGYTRYRLTDAMWHRMKPIPSGLRRLAGAAARAIPIPVWDAIGRAVGGSGGHARFGEEVYKGASVFGSRSIRELYLALLSRHSEVTSLVQHPSGVGIPAADVEDVEDMMRADLIGYLPDDVLTKLDRAAMSHSLETRVPFLDHRVVEFAMSLPFDVKLRAGESKWVLRRLLERHLPEELVHRPKMGFSVPIAAWLRGPLRPWADALLSVDSIRAHGYLRSEPVVRLWHEHLSGRADRSHILWHVLMFQSWLADKRR
jgi:asparagine synthase (glutamine-hydrolysing)